MTCCTSNRRKTHFVTSSTSMMSTLQTLKFLNYFIILVLLLAFLFCVFLSLFVCLFVHSFVFLYVHLSAPTQCITSLEGFAETLCLLLLFAHPDPSPTPFSLLFLKCQVNPNTVGFAPFWSLYGNGFNPFQRLVCLRRHSCMVQTDTAPYFYLLESGGKVGWGHENLLSSLL